MLDDLCLFVHVVEQGGFSQAARFTHIPAATVTRRIQRLEQQLNIKLLTRSARQCDLTHEGEEIFHAYAPLVAQFEQTQKHLANKSASLQGPLTVLAPTNLSHTILKNMWLGFTRAYPQIQLTLILSNQMEDIIKSKADLAIRVGPQPDSSLYQKRIGQITKIMVASNQYVSENPTVSSPEQLKHHRIIGTTITKEWRLTHTATNQTQSLFLRFANTFNDTSFAKYMALDSQGISLLPITEVMEEVKAGKLIHLLPEWTGEVRDIYAVWPTGNLLSRRASFLRDFIINYLNEHL
ncbi:LysR family transcriptional regulator [Aestuariibacter sp. AA17]|uniref:LysR family transcriptional regulator n=1 Tax=Fluctibacter corallii TaxID=2984329 RepID=A0ABT3AEG1_9ALTE|nr:LysR family transcriptional regulator [Aestuariibacter sp. AA17]MCV2886621.1 LysR family transcriptional regulator [Aestuariibacter sp. AA17]